MRSCSIRSSSTASLPMPSSISATDCTRPPRVSTSSWRASCRRSRNWSPRRRGPRARIVMVERGETDLRTLMVRAVREVSCPVSLPRVEIPADVGQSLSMLRGGLPGARWIAPENYHLTLRFIGDIDDALAHEIASLLGGVKRGAFELRSRRPVVVRRPQAARRRGDRGAAQALLDLQAEHERLMQRVGLEPEGRKYTPHVTLARLRDSSSRQVADYLATRGRSVRGRSGSRASCCSRRAPRSAADPMWSRRAIRCRIRAFPRKRDSSRSISSRRRLRGKRRLTPAGAGATARRGPRWRSRGRRP